MRLFGQLKWASLALAAASVLASCQPADDEEAAENALENDTATVAPLPVAEPPIDRASLLLHVARAASATALGQDDGRQQSTLDGRRFEVRIRFGCAVAASGAAPAAAPFRVSFTGDNRTLRISAVPDLDLDDPEIAQIPGEPFEAVEGFWMRQPWLLSSGCPRPAPPPPPEPEEENQREAAKEDTEQAAQENPTAVATQRVGLAQFFTSADPRTARRDGRAYELTKILQPSVEPSREGYDLVLSGRLRRLPNGRVITCRLEGPDRPPNCVVSAQFDRVRIETPGDGSMLAEWGRS